MPISGTFQIDLFSPNEQDTNELGTLTVTIKHGEEEVSVDTKNVTYSSMFFESF